MDGRWMVLAGGLVFAVGCTPFGGKNVADSGGRETMQTQSAKAEGGAASLHPKTIVSSAWMRLEAASMADGKTTAQRDQLMEQARSEFQHALTMDPKNRDALVGLTRLYEQRGDISHASETYLRLITACPEEAGAIWHEFALFQARQRDWAGAAQSAGMAVREDAENKIYAKTLGFCYVNAGDAEQGYLWLRNAMPEADARFNVAQALSHAGREAEAIDQASLALRLDPNHAGAAEMLAGRPKASAAETGGKVGGSGTPAEAIRPVGPGMMPDLSPPPPTLPNPLGGEPKVPALPEEPAVQPASGDTPIGPDPVLTSSWDDQELMRREPRSRAAGGAMLPPPPSEGPIRINVRGVTPVQ